MKIIHDRNKVQCEKKWNFYCKWCSLFYGQSLEYKLDLSFSTTSARLFLFFGGINVKGAGYKHNTTLLIDFDLLMKRNNAEEVQLV